MKRDFRRATARCVYVCLSLLMAIGGLPFQVRAGLLSTNHQLFFAQDAPLASTANIVRFLEQSTWGPNDALITQVQGSGFRAFLQSQFNTAATLYPVPTPAPPNKKVGCPVGSPPNCVRDNYTQYLNQVAFFQHAFSGADQLRQRVAFALHQILVISGDKIEQPSSMAPYLNLLLNDAFTNYRQILYDMTLNPAMGHYLDMVNNDKASADGKIQPNENYGREIMQLFSIGVYWLNPNGTQMLDTMNNPIPTYDQDTIEGFAHVFTGWTYAGDDGAPPPRFPNGKENFLYPMGLYRDRTGNDSHHDKGAKQLLSLTPGGVPVQLPANQDGQADLNQAIDNIFQHPNIGPFIGKQLIQHLVTSNPSPAYVSRVTDAFETGFSHGFGSKQRGDMQAVIAAILLDDEARGGVKTDADYGHLREPAQFVINTCRAFNVTSDGVLNNQAKGMGQDIFYPPSVFNYYPHAFIVPGTGLQGPEFGIQSSSAALSHENFANAIIFGHLSGTTLDLSGLVALAGGVHPTPLVDKLNQLLMHSTMSNEMYTTILNTVVAVDPGGNNLLLRAQTALYLVLASGQYQVER